MKPIARYAARIIALWGLSIALLPIAGASAQNPDLREIVPYMMLVVDTSGSMERLPGCVCETPGCVECLPDCSLDNVSGVPPVDADGNELKKNRWAVTLEALTGTIDDFECEALQRTIDNGMSYDLGYYLPYHQPWDCTGGGVCAIDSADSLFSQQTNGIIDEFSARVQFGLMTYDGMDTYVGAPPLVPEVDFNHNLSESEQGLWSYGGAKSFHYPNCVTDYMMDTGARSADAEQGGLVAIDSCTATNCAPWCDFCPAQPSQSVINREIEQALLSARPYGGTPIAASLDDLYYHFKEDLVDTLASCRNRYALLITDGYPDDDYRSFGCDCADAPDPDAACGGPPNDPATMHCPYPTPEQAAFDLVNGKSGDPAMIERLFVVGLAIDDQTVIDRLNAIADNGCPDTTCTALEADDLTTLVSSLSAVINDIIEPISRSVPSFASSSGTQATAKQYQISTGFKLPIKQGDPWTGIIERRRFVCDSGDVVPVPLSSAASDGDRFHIVLNSGIPANRKLWSVDWDVSQDPGSGHLYSVDSETTACSGSYCDTVRPLTDSFFSPERLGLAAGDTGGRDEVLAWMYGDVGTPRADKRLGDVYHSSPLVVGAPRFDTSDEAFNLFRGSTVVATRPLTLYVGSNDGILHAFSVEDFQQGTNSFQAGEELWGFVPPVMIDRMKESIDGSHHFSMDGSPVTKNVYFSRIKGLEATENEYHTVLITGMRNGGNAYVALDVTDPLNPEFLWQFTHEGMGLTYAKPAIGQAVFTVGAAGETKNGAVAILPGGKGTLGISGEPNDCTNGLSNPSMRKTGSGAVYKTYAPVAEGVIDTQTPQADHRGDVQCWNAAGRALYFVDVETGKSIKTLYKDASGQELIFPSPMVGNPIMFQSDVGTLGSRAFITDQDGVIWRIDISSSQQVEDQPLEGWTARPFHDIFWDRTPSSGQPSYEAPILSVDTDGRLVVLAGTGDTDNFTNATAENRVVSLTEVLAAGVVEPTGPEDYRAAINWEKRVKPNDGFAVSELVTGSMGLFNGQLFFGTFIPFSGSGNACDLGRGRIFAVNYLQHDENDLNPSTPQTWGPTVVDAAGSTQADSVINVPVSGAAENFMVMGLGVTQRPSCVSLDTGKYDVLSQSLQTVSQVAEPAVYLVAQASGDKSVGSLAQNRSGSELGSMELRLQKSTSVSRVTSWATSVD